MGAWGHGHFQNDVASDWAYALFEPGDHLPYVTAALATVAGPAAATVVDADAAAAALAAAEVVAAWLGRPSADVNDTVTVWARAQKAPPAPDLVALAAAAATRVRDASELRDLWAESDDFAAWVGAVDGLCARLAGA